MKLGYTTKHNDFIFFLRIEDYNLHEKIKGVGYTKWVSFIFDDEFWDLIPRGSVAIAKEDKIFLAELNVIHNKKKVKYRGVDKSK